VPQGEAQTPESNEVQFSSLEDAETAVEETDETDDTSLNGAALIDEIEEDDARATDGTEDDDDDE
jgi:hypothetical protein